MMDVPAQDVRRSRSPDAFQDRLAPLVRSVALDVAVTQRRVVRDQNAAFGANAKKGGGVGLGLTRVPCGVVANGNLAAQTEERRAADLDARAVQKVSVGPIDRQPSQLVRIVVVAVHEHERALQTAQDDQRVVRTISTRREVARTDDDVRIPCGFDDCMCGRDVSVQVGEGENAQGSHVDCRAKRNMTTPASVIMVDSTFARFIFSPSAKTPISNANTIEVSRSAVTSAIGACVNDHMTSA